MKSIFHLALIVTAIIVMPMAAALAQERKTQNLIIITIDGLRWQEVFRGADKELINNKRFVENGMDELKKEFWVDSAPERRSKLMPFLWEYIARNGQLYGNRDLGNRVNVKNPYWFSYPGYNEIFTGYPDIDVRSNKQGPNKNENVLEHFQKQEGLQGRVAAFTNWFKFDDILNEKRSRFPVNSGIKPVESNLNGQPLTAKQKEQNEWVRKIIQERKEKQLSLSRNDAMTYSMAKEFLEINRPRVLYIAFGGTDGTAHRGNYAGYLRAAQKIDGYVRDLWEYLQSQDQYRNKTTVFMTVDHGRGEGDKWTSHNSRIANSDQIWLAVIGPDTPAIGEINTAGQLYQNQYAQTLASFLGLSFKSSNPTGDAIPSVIK